MDISTVAPLSLPVLLLNLGMGLILSLIVAWYYTRYGASLSNRSQFSPILPILTMITLLVITIVKSSLALSLGLVGALSIVRFRTAIKDPEELIFLFFAIAIGLGLGADQRIPTLAAFSAIMAYLIGRKLISDKSNKSNRSNSMYLNIQMGIADNGSKLFSEVNDLLLNELAEVDLRRMDRTGSVLQMTYYVSIHDGVTLTKVMDILHSNYPDSSISFVEQNNLLGG